MKDKLKAILAQFKGGVLDNNPVLVQLLGMCPVLATTTSVANAIGMGLAATAVLIFSNLFISLLRKFIPNEVRIAAYIVIISGFVTSVELLIRAYLPEIDRALGLFIPLIVVNCIILARAEAFASKNGPIVSMIDGLAMGLGFTLALILLASVREVLGQGTFYGIPLFGEGFQPAVLFIAPSGAFISLGFLIALVQKLRDFRSEQDRLESTDPEVPETVDGTDAAAPVDAAGAASETEVEK